MISKKELIKVALEARKNAFTYSKGVGAALLTKDDKVFKGANMQSVISGLGVCAERAAIHNAVSNGSYNFDTIVVAFPSDQPVKPCGACLQIIHEFSEVANHDIKIIMTNKDGTKTKTSTIKKLLPNGYGPKEAGKNFKKYIKR